MLFIGLMWVYKLQTWRILAVVSTSKTLFVNLRKKFHEALSCSKLRLLKVFWPTRKESLQKSYSNKFETKNTVSQPMSFQI